MNITIAILIGFFLDCCFGDPHAMPHPVRAIGFLIAKGNKLLYRKAAPHRQFAAGAVLTVFVVAASFFVPFFLLKGLYHLHPLAGLAGESFLCYQIFAAKALKVESMYVYRALEQHLLEQARYYLSRIVGRDTEALNEEQIAKAAVETVAENLSDGVIAPLLFMAIGGAPLGLLYKGINTLDSMIGYNNDTYAYFGRFAAKLDDAANYIPARFAAFLMIIATFLCRFNLRQAILIYRRDKRNHKSPNSAQTEAVCAGALGLKLAGDSYYHGVLVPKPTIGDECQKADKEDIKRANQLMFFSSFLGVAFCVAVRFMIFTVL